METANTNRRRMQTIVNDLKEVKEQGDKALTDPLEINLLKGMFISTENMFLRFETLHDENQDLTDFAGNSVETEEDSNLRKLAKGYFHQCNAIWTALSGPPNPNSTSHNSFMNRSKVKLPTLDLPKFNGDRTKWPRFKDTFTSLILNDPDLNDIDRFHYLVRSLQDGASTVIAHVPVTDNNFTTAWNVLLENYDNKRLLATAYLDNLFSIKQLPQKPSAVALSQTVSQLTETVAAFKLLNIPDPAEFMFFHLARKCLDSTTREEFELQTDQMFPTFGDLIKYLRSRCTAAELATGLSHITSAGQLQKKDKKPARTSWTPRKSSASAVALLGSAGPSKIQTSATLPSSAKNKCPACKAPHLLVNCLKFSTASVAERHNLLKNWRGCRNCLRETTHAAHQCPSKWKCRFCHGRHHSLLHNIDQNSDQGYQDLAQDPTSNSNSSPKPALSSVASDHLSVMLGTAVCHILNAEGQHQLIRLVFDCGSHFSFITRACATRLGIAIENKTVNILGIGETPLHGFTGRAQCLLTPISSSCFPISINAVVLDKIVPPLPGFEVPKDVRDACAPYPLADSDFWRTRPIEFVLGCDLFAEILTGRVINIQPTRLRLIGTVFGFSVFGCSQDISEVSNSHIALHASRETALQSLEQDLHRFWDIEEPPAAIVADPSDEYCEELYRTTTYRTPEGRYVVRLPFQPSCSQPLNTRGMALQRLEHLESKLSRNSQISTKYTEFMLEYLTLDHMEVASRPGKYIIPHHCVVKGEGDNMKLRVVFDAAARSVTGSLNDLLFVGPKLQSSIVDILLNFRRYRYAFTTDIVKMYRQILVHPEDSLFQHILWRFDSAEAVTEYELKTISYGTNCAPYLALRTVRQLIADEASSFPLAARALEDEIYMDDIATGVATPAQALELLNQLVQITGKAGFALSRWASNNKEILKACCKVDPSAIVTEESVSLDSSLDCTNIKILGLQWNPSSDVFSYKTVVPHDTCAKRAVLSSIAKIYDPLGFLGPAVVAKQLVQEAWRKGLDWDEEFHADMRVKWMQFVQQLPLLSQINITRWVIPATGPYTIIIFADASEKAYCAAAYLRSVASNKPQSHLILAKTKLAPVKFTQSRGLYFVRHYLPLSYGKV